MSDTDLLPGSSSGESTVSDLRLNFTDEEASSEARVIEVLPTGKYVVNLVDVEVRFVKEGKNANKPYWHIDHVVQGGPYDGRHLWTNVMLFEGALYSLAQLLKATGCADALQSGRIPDAGFFEGKTVQVQVQRKKDDWAMKGAAPGDPTVYKNEIRGYASVVSDDSSTGGNSLLP